MKYLIPWVANTVLQGHRVPQGQRCMAAMSWDHVLNLMARALKRQLQNVSLSACFLAHGTFNHTVHFSYTTVMKPN